MKNPVKTYFPNGCTECGGEIQFLEEGLMYICNECGRFCYAYKEATNFNLEFEPKGSLATLKVNKLRNSVRGVLSKLYKQRVSVQTKKGPMETALINAVFANYCLAIRNGEDVKYAYQVSGGSENKEVYVVDTGEIVKVSDGEYKGVSNRTKANIWLAKEMGMAIRECKIKNMLEPLLLKAYKICENGIKEAKRKSIY